jgi:NADH:ubiquinone reductase (H+-translocating)
MAAGVRPKVIIVGAGFGGLWAARAFAHKPVDVWVIDRNNYHTFLPLLYQVAAAELEPGDIIYPVRSILHRHTNIHFLMGEVVTIDPAQRVVRTHKQSLEYDYLIISAGSRPYYYSVEGAAEHAFPLKDMDEAVSLRNHILCRFESANDEADAEVRRRMLTFAVVGGGPTGVEFASALAELVRNPLVKDYPGLDIHQVRILLLEATDHLLTGLPRRLQVYALKRLQRIGVEINFNATVSQVTSQSVTLQGGKVIPTETVVWTAGVQGEALRHKWDFPIRPNGQVNVLPTLQVPGHPEIYVTGDLAHVEQDGQPLLLIAPVATQEGEAAARNITRQISGAVPEPFRYHDPGMMVAIGRNAAAVQLGGLVFTGFPAWLLWVSVHLYRLIGFRSRLLVFINWAFDYLLFERVVRLITPLPENEALEKGC